MRFDPRVLALLSVAGLTGLLGSVLVIGDHRAGSGPPQLRLEWSDGDTSLDPLDGRRGEVVELRFRIANVGEGAAHGVRVAPWLYVGSSRRRLAATPQRIQPGPRPGESIESSVRFTVSAQLTEVCVEAHVLTVETLDRPEPSQEEGRVCRAVAVRRATTLRPGGPDPRPTAE